MLKLKDKQLKEAVIAADCFYLYLIMKQFKNKMNIYLQSVTLPQFILYSREHLRLLSVDFYVWFQAWRTLRYDLFSFYFRYFESESCKQEIEAQRRQLNLHLSKNEEQATSVEVDLKTEREWRQSLQETMQQDRDKISQLNHELTQYKLIGQVIYLLYFLNVVKHWKILKLLWI